MTDEMIVAMAKKGGVVQINFDCGYLNPEAATAEAARTARMRPLMTELRAKYAGDPDGMRKMFMEARKSMPHDPAVHTTLVDVVNHINHVVAIAGIDGVGLGSDFDGVLCVPEGLDGVDKWPNLTRALLEEGYTAAEVRKIYGENTLRLMSQVEQVAKSLRR